VDQAGVSTALVFNLKRDSPFSFKCQVCSACCHNKAIRVAPYEALRLARNIKITTTEVYRTYTEEGGIILRNKPDGSCIFLDSRGCGVHPDRPLVCRLFPLGQIIDSQGAAKYASMPLHPDCLGLFGTEGTVESYLELQGTSPYFRYDQVYSAAYKELVEKLSGVKSAAEVPGYPADLVAADSGAAAPGSLLSPWLDIDASVVSYCRRKRRDKPESLGEIITLHIQALKEWIAGL
jgi:Fe-S-cluster containining protein